MSANERIEAAKAEQEARDAVVKRASRSPVPAAVEAAVISYLASEGYAATSGADTSAAPAKTTGAAHRERPGSDDSAESPEPT